MAPPFTQREGRSINGIPTSPWKFGCSGTSMAAFQDPSRRASNLKQGHLWLYFERGRLRAHRHSIALKQTVLHSSENTVLLSLVRISI